MVSAFPTFLFFIKKDRVLVLKGANPKALADAVVEQKAKAGPAAFGGTGAALGGGAASGASTDPRAARLAALSRGAGSSLPSSHSVDAKVPPVSFNPAPQLHSLLLEMGIPAPRAWRALEATANASVETALEWLEQHQDDAGLDDPLPGALPPAETKPNEAVASSVPLVAAQSAAVPHGNGTGLDGAMTAEDDAAVASAQSNLAATGETRKLSLDEVSALLAKRRAEKVGHCLLGVHVLQLTIRLF
jgi:hypothetical protein